MENKENVIVKQKSNKGVIILLVILLVGALGYIAYDKFLIKDESKVTKATKTTTNETKNDTTIVDNTNKDEIQTLDKNQILKEVTQVYSDAFGGFYSPKPEVKQNVDYYKNKYDKLFTDKGVFMVYSMFNADEGTGIMSTMFNITDQGERKLSLVLATNDMVVATGVYEGQGDKTPYPEYIIFKKVDGVWKIDMFE